jgi:hypothetical protein
MNEIMTKLYERLPEDGIQRTYKAQTRKGYDTTGYGYQWVVDRLNELFGMDWEFDWHIMEKREGAYQSGTPYIELTVDVSITINHADKKYTRHCVGGHTSISFADALKGAITNGLKKTAAFYGIGADAFRGELDDDAALPDSPANKVAEKEKVKLDALNKLKSLPDNIKTAFELLNIDARKQWQFCNDRGWNTDKILSDVSKLIKKEDVA